MSDQRFNYVVTDSSIWVFDLDTYDEVVIDATCNPRLYVQARDAIRARDYASVFGMHSNKASNVVDLQQVISDCTTSMVTARTNGRFTLQGWTTQSDDQDPTESEWRLSYVPKNGSAPVCCVSGKFFDRVLSAFNDPHVLQVMEKFLDNVECNEYTSIAPVDLFEFLAVNNHPITTDGEFLAFKIVRSDLYDFHTASIYHGIGDVISLDPSEVDFNRQHTCSSGLHFCSKDYLPQYGGFFGKSDESTILVLKINPRDVAAFPRDYNNAKGRAVRYQVVAQISPTMYNEVISTLTQLEVVDVDDISRIVSEAAWKSSKTVAANRSGSQLRAEFNNDVQQAVNDAVNGAAIAVGPVPTIPHIGWVVISTRAKTGETIQCVGNATSRAQAREIAKKFNSDYGSDTVVYRVWDNR